MNLIEIETSKITPKGPKGEKKPQKEPVKKQKVRAVHPKPKLIVYTCRSQQFFEPDPNPKTAPNGPTRAKKAPYGVE